MTNLAPETRAQTTRELLDEARVDLGWRISKTDERIFTVRRGNLFYTLGHLDVETNGWDFYFLDREDCTRDDLPVGAPYLELNMHGRKRMEGDSRIKARYEEVREYIKTHGEGRVLQFPPQQPL